jgi:hypothetical protein
MIRVLLTFLFAIPVSRPTSGRVIQPTTQQISDLREGIKRPQREAPHLEQRIRIYGTLPPVPGYLRGSVLSYWVSLFMVYSSVFQTGILGTLGFRESVSGVLRNAVQGLGILCVVVLFSSLLI